MAEDLRTERLRGRFVVEVGARQAWPFITLCDVRSTPATEMRLYIDTEFRVEPGPAVFDDGDTERAVVALLDLNNRAVTDVRTGDSGDLTLVFDDGARTFVISGTPASFTTQAVWWLCATARLIDVQQRPRSRRQPDVEAASTAGIDAFEPPTLPAQRTFCSLYDLNSCHGQGPCDKRAGSEDLAYLSPYR